MDIELLATNAVKDSIAKTDVLSPYINETDREPVWDGNIYIYENKKKKKENLKKVPVQIKGKLSSVFDVNTIKYPIEISYLQDYLNDGGVVLFVVYISNDGERKQIYYSSLLPVKLRLILKSIKGNQKNKSIELKRFPDNNYQKVTILLNFYDNMQKQTSYARRELLSEEELIKRGLLESITFSVTEYGAQPNDIPRFLFHDEYYLYAKIKGTDILQPLEQIMVDAHFAIETKDEVYVGDTKYYDSYRRIYSKNIVELILGKCVQFRINNKEKKSTVLIKPTSILKDVILDYPFILALIDRKVLHLGNLVLDLSSALVSFPLETIEAYRNNYEYCMELTKLFDVLRLSKDCDLSQMTIEDKSKTYWLFCSIIEGKPVSGLKEDIPHVIKLDYINTKLALVFRPEGTRGTYYITDFFHDSSYEVFREIDGEKKLASKYVNLKAIDFLEIGNIDFEEIISSFKQYADEPYCFDDANQVLLEILLAFDESNDKRRDLLDLARRFSEELLGDIVGEDSMIIQLINSLQIEKRYRPLSKEQCAELVSIAERTCLEDKVQEYFIKIGANLLLENQATAEYYFQMLDKDSQEEFQHYPIFRFWKNEEN